MVIVGVGAAGPGSGRTTRDSLCVSLFEFSPPARKWQWSLFGTPRPLFINVCVCVYCRTASYVLGSRIP